MLIKSLIETFDIAPIESVSKGSLGKNIKTFDLLDFEPDAEIVGNIYHIVDSVMTTVEGWGRTHTPKIQITPLIKETIIAPSTEAFNDILEQLDSLNNMTFTLVKHEISKYASRVGLDNISSSFTCMLLDMCLHSRMPELSTVFDEMWDTWTSDVKDYCMNNYNDCVFDDLILPKLNPQVMLELPLEQVNRLKRGLYERAKSDLIDSELHALRLALLRLLEPVSTAIRNSSSNKSPYNIYLLKMDNRTRTVHAYSYGDIRIIKYNFSKGMYYVY